MGKLLVFNNGVPSSMRKKIMNRPKKQTRLCSAAGFSVVELLIVIAVVAIVSTFALTSFRNANKTFNVAGAMRNLTAYLEKARVDAVRRHVTDGSARIDVNSATSYTVHIDFSGGGTSSDRTISLPTGTTLRYTLPPATASIDPSTTPIAIQYDWRGRTTSTVLLTLTDSTAGVTPSTIVIGPAGDVSTDTTVTGPVTNPTPQNTTVTTTTAIKDMH
jgi:prepilin-type N-terminal cleavage/methylation domain-containing protein